MERRPPFTLEDAPNFPTDIEAQYILRRGHHSDIVEHMPTIRHYASMCDHVTEFGVRGGNSTVAILAGKPKKLVSYDPVKIDVIVDCLEQAATDTEFVFKQMSSLDEEIEKTDFLHIDSLHTYEHLCAELEKHASNVTAFIGIHDTMTFGHGDKSGGPGLMLAISKFLFQNQNEWQVTDHFYNNNGWTLIERTEHHLWEKTWIHNH